MLNDDLNIYVLQHKEYKDLHPTLGNRIPLQVGSWDKPKFCVLTDNTGENISNMNKIYLETTGHYWVLHNDKQSNYVGFEHCCRQFLSLETEDEIKKILNNYDIIAPIPIVNNETVLEQYTRVAIRNDILLCQEIIDELYPQYKGEFKIYINTTSPKLYYSNIFITKWDTFQKMYTFVFDILKRFEEIKGFKRISDWRSYVMSQNIDKEIHKERHPDLSWVDYHMRICGALSERLTSFYILVNGFNVYEVPVLAEWYE
jgi:hypothetical protein